MDMVLWTSIGAIFMAVFAMFIRMKAAKQPTSAKKIILPPLFMSTGAFMFVFPYFRVTPLEILEAVLVGMLFSILLIKTTKFEIRENDIYLKRSKAFIFILIGLLLIRIIAKSILSTSIDVGELGGMFWILAFSMIVPWRIAMYFSFRKMQQVHFGDMSSKPTI
ncbi:membrane protein CcdC involved in cytochrome C biogenesis [Cytobacillus horneckiae]|uniref:Cytochrome c biogenesis protein CcdC n=1 Tax=Cytobacillus horneckiae TaxID=549687 RepID=A0A2N0ZD65_9BACI|nr:cytochrome c biogenesis protein CcdC [Cytobacillus horneckiae]MBN6887336.1 cytochrome c biogenesis protein CcdC [Cytobacillus horneckiae]MCM3178074.1 cytochrome c biogenesis protein CcdC [Cytobacillus horneckiae]MEC1157188.1 cytochrome c biogenesis protein CcdC [Cytobacillus horneckiae]MED2938121.1 cytochrome c biogenesis protein CcdC [Cytobacillus horneckiae]PKG27458.1 cytochrome c biogenesis protein CcdC [Cytobacillus horneckiae]